MLRTVDTQPTTLRIWWMWMQLTAALVLTAAAAWPTPWRTPAPHWWLPAVDALQAAAPTLRWPLALLGLLYILAAAGGSYWESYRDGGLVAWLAPVAVLAPLLVFLSTALLTGLGRDVAGPNAISADAALRDSALLWALLSLYGVYYTVTAWAAMQRHIVAAILGYVLCTPLAFAGWESLRRETHRVDSARRLVTLAAGLRQYAEAYRELPPPVVRNDAGQPLLSWRVLVLPYVGAADLYAQFRLDESWDSPHNLPLLQQRPEVFRCEESRWNDHTSTRVVVVVGPETLFPPHGGVPLTSITRPVDDAAALLELNDGRERPWTAPRDAEWLHLPQELIPNPDGRLPVAVTIQGQVDDLKARSAAEGETADAAERFLRPRHDR
jgi:hypothetical protein